VGSLFNRFKVDAWSRPIKAEKEKPAPAAKERRAKAEAAVAAVQAKPAKKRGKRGRPPGKSRKAPAA